MQVASTPASRATLPVPSAMVGVNPPLSAGGSSAKAPTVTTCDVGADRPQLVSVAKLPPPSLIAAEQALGAPWEMIVLVMVALGALMAPPRPDPPDRVLLSTTTGPHEYTDPPPLMAVFPENVEFVIVVGPAYTAPPLAPRFDTNVLLEIVAEAGPSAPIAPPEPYAAPIAELPEK